MAPVTPLLIRFWLQWQCSRPLTRLALSLSQCSSSGPGQHLARLQRCSLLPSGFKAMPCRKL